MRFATLAVVLVLVTAAAAPTALGTVGAATDADGAAASVGPGAQLAGVVDVQGAELRSEVAERDLTHDVETARSADGRAAVVAREVASLEADVAALRERRERLRAAYEAGNVSESRYRARLAGLSTRATGVTRRLERTRDVADDLPAAALAARGVDEARLSGIESRASQLADAEATAATEAVVGTVPEARAGDDAGDEADDDGDRDRDDDRDDAAASTPTPTATPTPTPTPTPAPAGPGTPDDRPPPTADRGERDDGESVGVAEPSGSDDGDGNGDDEGTDGGDGSEGDDEQAPVDVPRGGEPGRTPVDDSGDGPDGGDGSDDSTDGPDDGGASDDSDDGSDDGGAPDDSTDGPDDGGASDGSDDGSDDGGAPDGSGDDTSAAPTKEDADVAPDDGDGSEAGTTDTDDDTTDDDTTDDGDAP